MKQLLSLFSILPLWLSVFQGSVTLTDQPVVRAVLFFSPSCGHCYYVITEVLPPLFEKYGDQLYIVGVDVTQPGGQALFLTVLNYFNLESGGVPFLVIGDGYLVGSVDIPEQLPGLIDQYLAQGGLDWPPIPGLAEALATPTPTEALPSTPLSTESAPIAANPTGTPAAMAYTPSPTPGIFVSGGSSGTLGERFARDLAGNTLAVIVLVGMVLSLIGGILYLWRASNPKSSHSWGWLIPVLCVLGLAVAGYLAYVEVTMSEAVCGPVGDCNAVQQSAYARLFGFLPIGILGILGYALILLAWFMSRFSNENLAVYASLSMLGLSTFGLLLSIYLTFLEPFVIGASCAWCLTSALIMTVLFGLSLSPGRIAFDWLAKGTQHEKYSEG
jgi:uncharacterized membrane protein/thiol-disulfide isomerase/thioredoxin